jgi:hypothetical protein
MKLTDFGTAAHPLRPSALIWLARCPVKCVLDEHVNDEGGPAAQTGSLVHKGVEAFHLEPDTGKKVAAAIAAMQSAAGKFPLACPKEARLYLDPYLLDPRNAHAEVVAVELKVTLTLPPHRLDPTGQPVHVRGTLDQIRRENGRLRVWDYKTGTKLSGWEMLHDYAYQQAAYTLAARQSGFPDVEPGGIIRGYGYRVRGAKLPAADGVFWDMPFDVTGAEYLMDRIRLQVALIRSGEVDFGPGTYCGYCPQKGLDTCTAEAGRKIFSLPVV